MAMIKPIVGEIHAFDATQPHTFYFETNGGDQVVKNEIKIINNTTNAVVYNHVVTIYRFNQTVPANTMVNGMQYAVSFRTYGVGDITSDWSTYVPFYCYTTPVVKLNITNNETVGSATYNVILRYSQKENEPIDYGYIELFDAYGSVISRSQNYYNTSQIEHQLQGLINGSNYRIKGTVVTQEQTVVETDEISFYVKYKQPQLSSKVELTSHNCDGYISIDSQYISISGKTNPSSPIYIDDEKIDCCGADSDILHENTGYYVKWDNGFKIPNKFLLRMWLNPAMIENKVAYISSDSGTNEWISIEFVRGTEYDYFVVKTNSGTNLTSDPFVHSNGTTYCFLWVKFNDNDIEIKTELLSTKLPTALNWGEENTNIIWNMTTDQTYIDSLNFETYTTSNVIVPIQGDFNNIVIGNGIFNHINITDNVDTVYSTEIPDWDYNTILDCNFNNNTNGGNFNITANQLSSIRVKRKDETSLEWVKIYERAVASESDTLSIHILDSFVPTNIEQTYAVVPVLHGEIEGDYIIEKITPHWQGVFISNGKQIFKLYNAVIYDNSTQNISVGTLLPIGSKYPTIIQNSENNYKSGSISAQLCGYKFDKTRKLDRNDIVKQANDFVKFLTDGTAKCLIDWNGNDIIFRTITSPTLSYNTYYSNGIINVAFSWAEQGQYNNQESMEMVGLLV